MLVILTWKFYIKKYEPNLLLFYFKTKIEADPINRAGSWLFVPILIEPWLFRIFRMFPVTSLDFSRPSSKPSLAKARAGWLFQKGSCFQQQSWWVGENDNFQLALSPNANIYRSKMATDKLAYFRVTILLKKCFRSCSRWKEIQTDISTKDEAEYFREIFPCRFFFLNCE